MKHLYVRHEQTVADPLQQERVLRALRIILEHQEDADASRTLCQSVNPQSAAGGLSSAIILSSGESVLATSLPVETIVGEANLSFE
jgi:hypothetical protein